MPKINVQAPDGKTLSIDAGPEIDPSQYDQMAEDALAHYNSGTNAYANLNSPENQKMRETYGENPGGIELAPVSKLVENANQVAGGYYGAQLAGSAATLAAKGIKVIKDLPSLEAGTKQLLNAFPRLPMDSARTIANDLDVIRRAKSMDEVKAGYENFGKQYGVLSGTDAFEAMQEGKGTNIPYRDIGDQAYNNVKEVKDTNDLQQALTGRQAYGELLKNKWKNPALDFDEQLVRRRQVELDDRISQFAPEYSQLKTDYHEASAVDDLNHVLAQNANMSPNKLALMTSVGLATGGLLGHASTGAELGASLGIAAQSPLVWKGALKGAALAGNVIDELASMNPLEGFIPGSYSPKPLQLAYKGQMYPENLEQLSNMLGTSKTPLLENKMFPNDLAEVSKYLGREITPDTELTQVEMSKLAVRARMERESARMAKQNQDIQGMLNRSKQALQNTGQMSQQDWIEEQKARLGPDYEAFLKSLQGMAKKGK